jgi:hypothetical protein
MAAALRNRRRGAPRHGSLRVLAVRRHVNRNAGRFRSRRSGDDAAIAFFAELGLKLEGRATIEGEWAGRVMFTVDDIDETLVRLRSRGAQLVGEVVQYEEAYRLCYIRGPEGLLIGLAEELSSSDPA